MSIKADIKRLKALLSPKKDIRFTTNPADITNEEGIIWVLFKL